MEWGRASTGAGGAPTRFYQEDQYYLTEKWLDKSEIQYFFAGAFCIAVWNLLCGGADLLWTHSLG